MDNQLTGTQYRRRVYLMRHGHVNYLQADGRPVKDSDAVHLTARGQREAKAMADLLRPVHFDRVVTSNLIRTQQTAAPILMDRDIEPEIYPDFREIRSGGLPYADSDSIPAQVYSLFHAEQPGLTWNGGDSLADFYHRVTNTFASLLLEPGWQSLLLVAHGVANRAILSWVTQADLAGFGAFEQDTACLNIIDADIEEGQIARRLLRQVNVTPHNLTKAGLYQTSIERGFAKSRRLPIDQG